jgi:biotin operon repressor
MKNYFLTLTLVLFIIPFGMSQDLPSYVPTDGLVAFYGFDGNVIDLTQNGYNGLIHNGQNGTINFSIDRKGISNSAIDFSSNPEWNKLGPYIEFQQTSNLCVDSDFSINFFINLSSNNIRGDVINKGPDNLNGNLLSRVYDNNTFKNGVSQVEYLFTQSDYLEGWKMITITNFDGLWSIYVNGDLSSSGNIGNISNNDSPYFLGAMPSGGSNGSHWPLQGSVDDLGFWNRALTEQEIQNLYTSSNGDILLNGTVSAENNQIKNVADPTHSQDVVTKNYTYSKAEVDALINEIRTELGNQIDNDNDGYTEGMGDCDDSDLEVNPAAFEISDDGIDNDCDGQIDELVPNYVPSNGLVAFYPFAGDLEDKSGNEYHLTNSNVSFTDDANLPSNQALYFNGNSSHLYTSKSFSELTSDPNQTISFWFKNISDNWRAIFTIGDSDGGRIVVIPNTINEKIAVIGTDDCHLCGESGGSEGIDIEVNNFRDGWHHIVVSTNSNELKLFLNGNLISTTNHSGFNCDNDNYRLWLGNDIICAPEWFEMNMDDVGIWDRELSAGEINNLYQRN